MHRIILAIALVILPTFCATSAAASRYRIESTDRILNRYWEELALLQSGQSLYSDVLPHLTSPTSGTETSDNVVGKLLNERIAAYDDKTNFQLDNWGLFKSNGDNSLQLITRFMPYLEHISSADTLPVHRVGLTSEAWIMPSEHVQIHLRMRLENHGELYSQFNGRVWDEKITGWLDHGAVYYYNKGFFGSIGRSSMIWGPEQRDALLLSDNAPQLDRIWLGYEHRAIRFDYFISRLDDVKYNDSTLVRYMSAHRLSFRKQNAFELGLSEVALFGGYGRPVDWRYINPFVPYYWEQWNRGSDDNILFGLDFAIYWPHQCRIFGELLIDDFQIDLKSEPHQVGYKLGIDMMEPLGLNRVFTKASYTRVNTTVYGQNQPQNLYLYYNKPIGYFGGNDQDRFLAMARYHASRALDLELEFQFNRRGEGRIEKHDRSGVPFEEKFPIGIVEKSPSVQATALWFSRNLIEARLSARYSYFDNYKHVCGDNHSRIDLNLFFAYNIQGLID
ncbi:MAG: hypothetical protein IPH59_14435 [bacterium]|nr:hypothetical protein [bacterium]